MWPDCEITRGKIARRQWTRVHGPPPPGMWVLHKCDTPQCSNMAHLFLGTPSNNTQDMVAKGRAKWQRSRERPHALAPQMLFDSGVTPMELRRRIAALTGHTLTRAAVRFWYTDVPPGVLPNTPRVSIRWAVAHAAGINLVAYTAACANDFETMATNISRGPHNGPYVDPDVPAPSATKIDKFALVSAFIGERGSITNADAISCIGRFGGQLLANYERQGRLVRLRQGVYGHPASADALDIPRATLYAACAGDLHLPSPPPPDTIPGHDGPVHTAPAGGSP